MRKIDIIYDNLLFLLDQITYRGPLFDTYHDSKDEEIQNDLVDLSEKIIEEIEKMMESKASLGFHTDFTSLKLYLDDFTAKFADYPENRINEIYILIGIVQKLANELSESLINLEEEVDDNEFSIIDLPKDINKHNFLAYDVSDYKKSLFLFDLTNATEFTTYLDEIADGIDILFYLAAKVGQNGNPLTSKKYILVNSTHAVKNTMVWATICLHIVKAGESVHYGYDYTQKPRFTTLSTIDLGLSYQQFNDSINIISEYNNQRDILDKYLRIYHILENFMYKSPLVTLEREANGEVFSIRDFKRMYDKINDSEPNMLKRLINDIFSLNHSAATTFKAEILAKWAALVPNYFANDINIDFLISKLGITTRKGDLLSHASINNDNITDFFSKLVYYFRNTIVHNRETEFHLTHENLLSHPHMADTAKVLLESFLIPTIEEIVFHLITVQNNIVWYDKSELNLWEEG